MWFLATSSAEDSSCTPLGNNTGVGYEDTLDKSSGNSKHACRLPCHVKIQVHSLRRTRKERKVVIIHCHLPTQLWRDKILHLTCMDTMVRLIADGLGVGFLRLGVLFNGLDTISKLI